MIEPLYMWLWSRQAALRHHMIDNYFSYLGRQSVLYILHHSFMRLQQFFIKAKLRIQEHLADMGQGLQCCSIENQQNPFYVVNFLMGVESAATT